MRITIAITTAIAIRAVYPQAVIAVGVQTDIIQHYACEVRSGASNASLRLDDLFSRRRAAFDHEKHAVH